MPLCQWCGDDGAVVSVVLCGDIGVREFEVCLTCMKLYGAGDIEALVLRVVREVAP
jgi:hypothetical protein